jgi:hypothetical protein
VRRLICGLPTRAYGTFFIEVMIAATDSKSKKSAYEKTIAHLLKFDSETSRWPDDAEFKKAWLELPLYRKLARPRLRFILRALEEHVRLAEGRTEPFPVPTRLEVEHVLPQTWETYWPLPKGSPANAAEKRNELLHTIGNLTLLTKKLNIGMSNAAWAKDRNGLPCKRKSIKQYSLMMLSKDIIDQDDWSEKKIVARSNSLFKVALKIWPHP